MKASKFFDIYSDGAKELFSRPIFIVISLVLGLLITFVSILGKTITPGLESTFSNVAWTAVAGLIVLALVSYVSAGLIGLERKDGLKEFFSVAKKFWLGNLVISLTVVILSNVLLSGSIYLFTRLMLSIRPAFEVTNETVLWVLPRFIVLIWLMGVIIFFTFSNVFLVVEKLRVRKAIKRSFKFVKREYPATLFLVISFWIVYRLVNQIGGFMGDVVIYGLVFPYFVLVLTKFVRK
ncbi:MAG: hypothetical protein ABH864_01675 [archaeon]